MTVNKIRHSHRIVYFFYKFLRFGALLRCLHNRKYNIYSNNNSKDILIFAFY